MAGEEPAWLEAAAPEEPEATPAVPQAVVYEDPEATHEPTAVTALATTATLSPTNTATPTVAGTPRTIAAAIAAATAAINPARTAAPTPVTAPAATAAATPATAPATTAAAEAATEATTPSKRARSAEHPAVSRSTHTTPGRTVSLVDLDRRVAQPEVQSSKRNASSSRAPEAAGENAAPPKKKRATRASRRAEAKAKAEEEKAGATDKAGAAENQLCFPTRLRERIAELEKQQVVEATRCKEEVATERERCKRSLLRFKRDAEQEKHELKQQLQAAKKQAEQAVQATASDPVASLSKSLHSGASHAPETVACAAQEHSEVDANDQFLSKAALDAAVAAALEGAEKKHRDREGALQARLDAAEKHTEKEGALPARLEAAEKPSDRESALKARLDAVEKPSDRECALQGRLEAAEQKHGEREHALQARLDSAEKHTEKERILQARLEAAEQIHSESRHALVARLEAADKKHHERERVLQASLEAAEQKHSEREHALQASLQAAEEKIREKELALKASELVAEVENALVSPSKRTCDGSRKVYRTVADSQAAAKQPVSPAEKKGMPLPDKKGLYAPKAPTALPTMSDAATKACNAPEVKHPDVPVAKTPNVPSVSPSTGRKVYKTVAQKLAEVNASPGTLSHADTEVNAGKAPPAVPMASRTLPNAPPVLAQAQAALPKPPPTQVKAQPPVLAMAQPPVSVTPSSSVPSCSPSRSVVVTATAGVQTIQELCDVATQVTRRSPRHEAAGTVQLQVSVVDASAAAAPKRPVMTDAATQVTVNTDVAEGSKIDAVGEPKRPTMVDAGTQVRCLNRDPEAGKKDDAPVQTALQNEGQQSRAVSMVPYTVVESGHHPMEDVQMSEEVTVAARRAVSEAPQEPHAHAVTTATSCEDILRVKELKELAEMLSTTHAGSVVQLGKHAIDTPASSSSDSDHWRSVAMWPQQAAITEQQATEGLLSLVPCLEDDQRVCVISGGGTKVAGGSIQLDGKAALVFDASCAGVEVSGTEFSDGVVVCHGSGCRVTFTNVTFIACTLAVLDGATVTLNNTSSSFDVAQSQGLALFANGTGTKVYMHGSSITGGTQGVTIQAQAQLEASSLAITKVAVAGIEVKDAGSALVLKNSTLSEFSDRHNELNIVCGLHVHEGAKADLACVKFSRMFCGVDLRDRATATLDFCSVEDTIDCCVACTQDAQGTITNCTLSRSLQLHGLYVGAGSQMHAQNCKFLQNAKDGACVFYGGILHLDSCLCMGSKGSGFSVGHKAILKLANCISELNSQGVMVADGGKLVAEKTCVSRSSEIGIRICDQGVGILKECIVTRCGHQGIVVAKPRSKIDMHACTVDHTQHACVFVGEGARSLLKGSTFAASVTCAGVAADGKDTFVEVESCKFKHNAKYGALATAGAVMVVKKSASSGNKLEGYMAHTHARMDVTECSSDGDKSEGHGILCMHECRFNEKHNHQPVAVRPCAAVKKDARSVKKVVQVEKSPTQPK